MEPNRAHRNFRRASRHPYGPKAEAELRTSLSNVTRLIFDLSALEYISSAGLRVLLTAQKVMNRQGDMIVKGASDVIMEIFEVTGFVDILTLE